MSFIQQTLLLDGNGNLLRSCDSLFDTHHLVNQVIIPHFPFLESIFDKLLHELGQGKVVVFPCVETTLDFLPGYYDYHFTCIKKNGIPIIQWQIFDATESYLQIKNNQQTYNEKQAFPKNRS